MLTRLRSTEFVLLLFPVAYSAIGLALLALVRQGAPLDANALRPAWVLAGGLAVAHLALVAANFRGDMVLLPVTATLTATGMVMVRRLDAAVADRQLVWCLLGLAVLVGTVLLLRDLSILRRYRYVWALGGLLLVAATLVFGLDTGGTGARLWLGFGGYNFQPSELLKILLVVYLASYLAENQEILAAGDYRLGPLRLPPLPHLAPLAVMLGLSLTLLAVQRDLGAAMLLFGIYLGMLYMASGHLSYVLAGLVPFAAGAWAAARALPYVAARVEVWLDPWSRAAANGYQIVQALIAISAGGVFGVGLGFGYPGYVPAVQTDYIIAAVGEEMGMAGILAVMALYMVLVGRGFSIAMRARQGFDALLAAGLSTVLALQTLIILAGSLKVIPLTGITLPFVSYGGSSLVTNYLIIGILLRISGNEAANRPAERAE
jgi:cell division protein FtsW (lipid II flippase)